MYLISYSPTRTQPSLTGGIFMRSLKCVAFDYELRFFENDILGNIYFIFFIYETTSCFVLNKMIRNKQQKTRLISIAFQICQYSVLLVN